MSFRMGCGMSLIAALALPAAVFAGIKLPDAGSEATLGPAILDHLALSEAAAGISGGNPQPVASIWQCGDRKYPLAGRELKASDPPLAFSLRVAKPGPKLTLELREFRRSNDGRVAYLVEVNGQRLQLRNRKFLGAGPSSAFVDIPQSLALAGTLNIRLSNCCATMQATGIGVIRDGRLGGEWSPDMDLLPILEQQRELGVPAGINWELGGARSVVGDLPLAYAMGCDHLTLFNIADERLAEIAPSLKAGWKELKPAAWRNLVFSTERFRIGETSLQKYFVDTQGVATERWPERTYGIFGKEPGKSGHALMHFTSRELTGEAVFSQIALKYDARAFVFDFAKGGGSDNPGGYLAVRAGTRRDQLAEVDRMFNGVKQAGERIDLTGIANGAPEL